MCMDDYLWFFGVIKTNFLGNDMPKENMQKNHPQVYLEECKYRVKKNTNF